jgi:hypothetical protein
MNSQPDKARNGRSFLRWLFSWRTARRATIALACFVTFIALVYTEEDWRGKRAWKQCKAELEAKGAILDWSAFIPPPVPDEQNFFKAPGIDESNWVGRGGTALSKRFYEALSKANEHSNALLIAEVVVVPPGSEALLRLDDTNTPVQARKLIEDTLGSTLPSALGFTLVARPLEGIRPARITLSASHTITTTDLVNLFPMLNNPSYASSWQNPLRIERAGTDSFHMALSPPPESADDRLARSESLNGEFNTIRAALKRPYARMDGDYTQPYAIPIPNFIMMRALAQTLADRAKCHLLLDHPAAALGDLTLLHDVCHVLEAKPTGQPMTLVAAMIDVAITGLYASTIAEGFQLDAWREPQLIALQQQLAQTDLLPIITESFLDGRAATAASLENIPPADWFEQMTKGNGQDVHVLEMLKNPFFAFLLFAPRGWVYQNMVFGAKLHPLFEIGDTAKHLVLPEIAQRDRKEIDARSKWSPYSFLRNIANPNFTKAWQTTAHNQTLVDQAQIACALERYRLACGEYPGTLAALASQYIEKVPHDIIGGQPLHYRRSPDGTILLYSIGWNEKDDGGVAGLESNGNDDLGSGDWVWQGSQRRSGQTGGAAKTVTTDHSDRTDKKMVFTASPKSP